MTQIIEIEVPGILPGDYDYINVEFTGIVSMQDDSFDYEGGTQSYPKYLAIDGDPTWSRAKHTKWENDAIAVFMAQKEKCDSISDELVKAAESELACAEYDCHD